MPSRRTFLCTVGATMIGGFTGCHQLDQRVAGYVQLKSITGVRREDGHETGKTVLRVTLSSPPGAAEPELSALKEPWNDRFEDVHNPVVSANLHEDLTREFERMRYVVGVCSPSWADNTEEPIGCYNVATSRENFNSVQVHDHVTATSDGTYLTIHSTDGKWSFSSH